jgi:hypothetical protein
MLQEACGLEPMPHSFCFWLLAFSSVVRNLTMFEQVREETEMQRYAKMSFTLVFLSLAILWAGCGGPSTEVAPVGLTAEVKASAGTPGAAEAKSIDVPEWFLNPPEDPDYLYAVGTALQLDMQNAIDAAKHSGRVEISSQIEVRVTSLFKRFSEEVGVGDDAQLLAMITSVSKAVADQLLNASRQAQQDVRREGKSYRVYTLMELHVGEMKAAALDQVKNEKNLYTRFRASEGFKELEAEVEKYEQWKKEQGQG